MAKKTDQQLRIRSMRVQGKTTAEIANALGITPASVRSCERYVRRNGKPGRPPKRAA